MRRVLKEEIIKDGKISWNDMVGKNIQFEYDDIKGEFLLCEYNSKTGKAKTNYNGITTDTYISQITSGHLAYIIGLKTRKYKFNVGDKIGENIYITKQIRIDNQKAYEYKCSKCGCVNKSIEGTLLGIINKGYNITCIACGKRSLKIIKGINSIWDTDKDVAKLLLNKDDGYKYSIGTHVKLKFKCSQCGSIKEMTPNTVKKNGIMCNNCSDGISYPNKIMSEILKQLNCNFNKEVKYDWCKFKNYNSNKLRRGIYDFEFELNNKKYIVEMDGGFHNNTTTFKTKEESQYIDNMKDKLAIENGYEIIRIDCDYNNNNFINYIKNNILKSKLNELFDLSKIDWNDIEYNIFNKSIVKDICNLYNSGENIKNIFSILNLSKPTIRKYLKIGNDINITKYDINLNRKKGMLNTIKTNKEKCSIPLICFNNNKIYTSLKDCENNSSYDFGFKINKTCIWRVCNNKTKSYKGFTFKYLKDLSTQELLQTKQKLIQQNKSTQYIDNELNKRKQLNKSI